MRAVRSSTGTAVEGVDGALYVALFAVEARHVEDDLFGVGVDLLRSLELVPRPWRSRGSGRRAGRAAGGLHVVGLELGELLVLGDGELQHLAGLRGLHVAERAQIDLAEQGVGFDVVRVSS